MKREKIIKTVVIIIGFVLGLFIAEIGYRMYHFLTFETHKDSRIGNELLINDTHKERTLGEVIRLSTEKKIVYELIPNSIFKFQNVIVKINENGFRDKTYIEKKKDKTIRIIGLGDSVMFGWGIEEKKCYLDQLETKLNKEEEESFEIINTSVPGYNTVMEIEVLKRKIDLIEVDIVIINFVANDFDLPNFVRERPNYLGIKKSMILQLFKSSNGRDKRIGDAPFDMENGRYQRDPSKVRPEYKELIGEESCLNSLKELSEISKIHDFKVIFLSDNPYFEVPKSVKEKSKEFGFKYVETKAYWERYKSENKTLEWALSEKDSHPSLVGHSVISEILYDLIKEMQYKEGNNSK